jgi:hypothetical protein
LRTPDTNAAKDKLFRAIDLHQSLRCAKRPLGKSDNGLIAHLADNIGMKQRINHSAKNSASEQSDRRRRSRLNGVAEGWIVPDDGNFSDPWEVRVHDVSRHGVGFESAERITDGEVVRLRIGRGPIKLAKRIRIVRCNEGEGGLYRIGGEFI